MIPLFWLNLADPGEVCGTLITESGPQITTEDGNALVTECFVPPAPVVVLHPGKVWKRRYPYWQSSNVPITDDEELMILAAIEDD